MTRLEGLRGTFSALSGPSGAYVDSFIGKNIAVLLQLAQYKRNQNRKRQSLKAKDEVHEQNNELRRQKTDKVDYIMVFYSLIEATS